MTPVFRNLRAICIVAALLPVLLFHARADDFLTPRVGGTGGGAAVRLKCKQGAFLVGIAGRAGLWIDAMGPVCAKWDSAKHTFELPVVGALRGGSGGAQITVMCPANSAVSGWEIRPTRGEKSYVEYVAPECRAMLPPHDVVRVGRIQFGQRSPPQSGPFVGVFGAAESWHGCPKDHFAIGIFLHAGGYVDRAGLICGRAPPKIIRPLGKRRLD